MTKVVVNPNLPFFDRDSFLTPFDKMFDQMIEQQFPNVVQQVGVKPYQGTAYPKVNVYEYDDKIGLIAEIPGLKKKQLNIEVELLDGDNISASFTDGILSISIPKLEPEKPKKKSVKIS